MMTRVSPHQSFGFISKKFANFMRSPFILRTTYVITTHFPSDFKHFKITLYYKVFPKAF